MILIVLLWILLLLAGISYSRQISPVAFSQENTIVLRGICSIEIMIGHLGIVLDSVILFANRKAGILFVGIFFTLSGYGLMYNVGHKKNYLDDFLLKRLSKIIVPAYIVFFANIFLHSIITGDISYIIYSVHPGYIFKSINWFVWELAGGYVIFYICAKLDRTLEKTHFLLLGVSGAFVILAFYTGMDNPWYGSTLCFWLGVFYYMRREQFKKIFAIEHFFISNIVCGLFLCVSILVFFLWGG